MPSPLGHALAGVAAGWLVVGAPSIVDPRERPRALKEAAIFGALAMLPDIDLLFDAHRGPTHSIGAALIVGVLAAVATFNWRFAIACAAAYASHIPLDWSSHDNTPPIGIMALWPFTHDYYASRLPLFLAISRRYYHGWRFVITNAIAVAREIAILGPLVALVIVTRRRPPSDPSS
jgi:inner membrane protein